MGTTRADRYERPARRRGLQGQRQRAAVTAAVRALAAAGLTGLVGTCAALSTAAVRSVSAPVPGLDGAVSAMAAVGVAVVSGLWCCGAAATAAAALARGPGRTGRAAARLDSAAAAVTPALLRRLVAVALGVGALGSATGPALAAGSPVELSWPSTAAAATLTSTPTPTATPGSGSPAPAEQQVVVVRRGDTLWDLAAAALPPGARAADVAAAWPRWYAANRAVIGDDPDRLYPGQLLSPPAPSAP